MTNPAKLRMLVLAAALLCPAVTQAQITVSDIGTTAPTPGTYDISQFNTGGGNPAGLNYYWDDGHQHGGTGAGYTGQSFTTSNNAAGYTLTSVAIKTAGGGGDTPTRSQSFTLCIYQLSGTGLATATLVSSNNATTALSAEGDWMRWSGLTVTLQPNTTYAYGFGITPGVTENWELLDTGSGWPYTGGQVCEIENAGGKVTYATTQNSYDGTFDIGLVEPAAPIAAAPAENPAYANLGVLTGTSVTLTAAAVGSSPIYYQWLTDGGSGTLTNIPGATATNLAVNTTGWANGNYLFEYVATNAFGGTTSAVATVEISSDLMVDIGTNTPTPGALDIYQLAYTNQTDDSLNYYTDGGAGHGAWCGQTFTTGTNTMGYVVQTLAWKSAGNGSSFSDYQLYDVYFYSLSPDGTTATLIYTNQCYGGGVQNDWFQFVGLNVPLSPNSMYAYTFGRDSTSTGWEHIGDEGGNPYPGGQICTIPGAAGGTVTYGTAGTSDATFDLGLVVSQAPHTSQPTYTPNVNPVYAGTVVTLSETPVGGLPFSYQWLTDGGSGGALTNLPSATGSTLAVDTTSFAVGTYNYAVIVTNAYGASTSAVVALTITGSSAPLLVNDISPGTVSEGYVGQTLTLSASFAGTMPINYQWTLDQGNGPTPMSAASNAGAVSNVLVLSNLQLTNAGIYTLIATNAVGGPVSSSSSTLTVLPDPAPPASGSYGALVLSMDPEAYWPLNETNDPSTGTLPAYDATGNNLDGLYGVSAQDGFDGVVGPQPPAFPGFATNNTALTSTLSLTNSWVTLPPLNLDTNAVTIAMWINPNGPVSSSAGLLMNRKGGDAAGFCFGTADNSSGMYELGYTWNTNSSATWGYHSGLYPVPGIWSFVALVVQTNQATIYLYYIDPNTGQPDLLSAVNPIAHGVEQFSGGTTWLGDDENSLTRVFNGSIDEAAVYKSALSSDQMLALFSKGAGLSPLPPAIATQPQSAGAYAGNTVKFTAAGINGSSPISYQWQFNGTNLANGGAISGAQTASLTITNVTLANSGNYQLVTSNYVGVTLSSNATLTVVVPVPGSYEAAVVADSPYVFWKLNETNDPSVGGVPAYDYVRGLNGVYQTGSQNGFDGILGPQFAGFPTNDTALATFASTADSYVTASAPSLTVSNLTYVMWINPSGPVENWAGLLIDRGGPGNGFGFGGATDGTGMSELGYTWDQNTTWSYDSSLFPPANQWSLVALVIQPTQATIYLINSNGVQTAVDAESEDAEQIGLAWHIGDDAQGSAGARTFPGSIADVAVYTSALSGSQITGLYNAALQVAPSVYLTVTPAAGGNITLSWPQGTLLQSTNVTGPWVTNSASSPYTTPAAGSGMFYRVRVQ